MSRPLPAEIADLLGATDAAESGAAWSRFLNRHSGLLMHAARSFGTSYDSAMDRYRYIVEELARNDFRRLRAYSPEGPGKFSTWLVVVAQRLCRDYHRKRFGRLRTADEEVVDSRAVRWRLQELIADELDPSLTPEADTEDAEFSLRRRELSALLDRVLDGLTERDRLLLRYRFEDERSFPEIAELMRFPSVFSAYRQLRRLLAQLRANLQQRGVDGPRP